MYTLAPDEKTTLVMAYTLNGLYRGDLVTKTTVIRLLNWVRTDNAPKFLHLTKVNALTIASSAKPSVYSELFLPLADVIGFHLAPPASEPLDYESDEKNRIMVDMTAMVGTFLFNGKTRISSQMDLTQSLEMIKTNWLSFYEVNISNPFVPQMTIQAPMVVIAPNRVSMGLA